MSLLSILAEYGRDVSYMSTDSPTGKTSRSTNDGFPVDPLHFTSSIPYMLPSSFDGRKWQNCITHDFEKQLKSQVRILSESLFREENVYGQQALSCRWIQTGTADMIKKTKSDGSFAERTKFYKTLSCANK